MSDLTPQSAEEKTDKANALWEIRQLDTLYKLLSYGVQAAITYPKLLETTRSIETNDKINFLIYPKSKLKVGPRATKNREAQYQKRKLEADELAAFAKSERATELSSLHSLLVVRLCTILEVTVDDLACAALRKPDKWTQPEVVGRLSGPLLQFLEASVDERSEYLCDELRLVTKASLKPGVGRFEDLLAPIGLGGAVEATVRRVLLEAIEVRNAIVHRAGTVDKQLKTRCPWIPEAIGQPIRITHSRYWAYLGGITCYLATLYLRASERGILQIRDEQLAVVAECKQAFLGLAEEGRSEASSSEGS